MDHVRLLQNDQVFHGLHDVWAVNDQVQNLLSAKIPSLFFKVGEQVIELFFPQSGTLLGADSEDPGEQTFTLTGAIGEFTLRIVFHSIPFGGALGVGPFHDVYVEYDVQSDDTLTTAMAGFADNIGFAIAGTGDLVDGRIKVPTYKAATRPNVGTALALKYASAADDTGTITLVGAASAGAEQNEYDFTIEVLPKPPGLIPLSADTYPAHPGIKFLGATESPVFNASATEQAVTCGQSFFPIDNYNTASQGDLSLNFVEDQNTNITRVYSQITGIASTNTSEIVIPNLFPNGQTYGIILTTDSQRYPGKGKDKRVFRRVKSNGFQVSFDKQHKPISAKLSLIKTDADELCYFDFYAPSLT